MIHGLPKGFPDLFGVILNDHSANGLPVPVYIECKIHPNKPSQEQTEFIEAYRAGGCCAGVCYTVTEAVRLIRPHLKDGEKTFPDSVLDRWDRLYQ